ncbi:uncharacterized protein A4U43_C01F35810 [Asparagus officinalis]|uniref:RIN4 pathogenic type III effector avirulence factor Avr cleavage site domain-containing protein n=1 Tax=Asparagus officinalis TaxID=4686 RepID=A0A5P1FXS4_ASPOF|nr:uncharacterized protein A4U43_C01F35810 [Asparagus officinalis]
MEKDRPLPKFGDWDVNDPASAEGFTFIFNKARDEKKTGGNTPKPDSPAKEGTSFKQGSYSKSNNVRETSVTSVKSANGNYIHESYHRTV